MANPSVSLFQTAKHSYQPTSVQRRQTIFRAGQQSLGNAKENVKHFHLEHYKIYTS